MTKYIEHEYENDSIEVTHIAYLPDGSIDHARRFTYNDKGQLLKKEYDHKEQLYDYTTYEYREDGKVQSFSIYNPDGTLKTFYDYEYDEEGKMILYNAYDAEKNPTGYYTFDYNADGRRIRDSYHYGDELDFYIEYVFSCD